VGVYGNVGVGVDGGVRTRGAGVFVGGQVYMSVWVYMWVCCGCIWGCVCGCGVYVYVGVGVGEGVYVGCV